MEANNPLTDPIEQPKKSASLMGLPTPAPIYRNLVVVHYHLRPGGVRRIIELALRHIALATPNPLAAIVLATGEKPEPNWREILTRSLPGTAVHFFWEPAFRYLSEQRSSHEVIRGKVRSALDKLAKTFPPAETLFWAQNLGLGRNLILSDELAKFSARIRSGATLASSRPMVRKSVGALERNAHVRLSFARCGRKGLLCGEGACLPCYHQQARPCRLEQTSRWTGEIPAESFRTQRTTISHADSRRAQLVEISPGGRLPDLDFSDAISAEEKPGGGSLVGAMASSGGMVRYHRRGQFTRGAKLCAATREHGAARKMENSVPRP